MALNDWQDGAGGGTPVTAARLNERDAAIVAAQSAADDAASDAAEAASTASWGSVSGKPSTFTPAAHVHSVTDVTGLQAILDDYETRIATLETP